MAKRQVFYSFHFDNDVFRVQQIRQMGLLEGNEPVSPNDWETIKRGKDNSIKKWIDDNLKYKSCLVVLIGADTANREWVRYEIEQAWNSGKAILGVYIHNLRCPKAGTCRQGPNPFDHFTLNANGKKLSSVVSCHNPNSYDAYNDIKQNLEFWIESALINRNYS